jgi:hypothetical protein
MIRVVRFPESRPRIWIGEVEEYVLDGSRGILRFDGPEHTFRRVALPVTTKMVTYETPRDEDECDEHTKHGRLTYTVEILHVDMGKDTSEGAWDEEFGGYIILTPTCKQTVHFRVVAAEAADAVDLDTCDVLSIGGASHIEEFDDTEFIPLE